ncbi:MAG: copper chaperone PCu(A)C [Alphaproteobacteria bacterium]|jgi:hypothetical protein|nr:copper chaperone PCu(A)C [Alphaproteobacteria bacterium]
MKKLRILLAMLVAAVWLSPAAAMAGEFKLGDIAVVQPWARATPKLAKTGAAFMTIRNTGGEADRLLAVRGAISKKAGIHQSMMEAGIMKMRPAGAIEVPAGGMAMLKPGGYHVMFMGLHAPLQEGASFPLTLVFEKAGELRVDVMVMKIGARSGMKMKH